MSGVAKKDWISTVCWVWVVFFVCWKVYLLVAGQPLAYWLDITNPSLFGLLFTACVITLIVRRMRAKPR
jgi:hypothetical protein